MTQLRVTLPDHWTPAQTDAAIELLELVLIDMWQQYEAVLWQLRLHQAGLEPGYDEFQPPEELDHGLDIGEHEIPF